MSGLYCNRGRPIQYVQRVLIRLGVILLMALASACGNEEIRSYIPPEMERCVDYTRQVIETRQENYWRYTDRALEDGESVWVAGRRFDFEYVRSKSGEYKPTFRNSDVWVRKGEFLPGITVILRRDVAGMKKDMPGVILSNIDPGGPKIIIKMDCVMGVSPAGERYASIESLVSRLPKGPSGYTVSVNEELGLYQALDHSEWGYDYFYKHHDGKVDMHFPAIFCDRDISTGNCSAVVTAWNNIKLRYSFPRRQLEDFSRIYQATKVKIDTALAKGEQ